MTSAALKKLSLAMLCAIGGVALPAASFAEATDAAMTTLLKQAEFWQSHNRPDLARETLARALQVQPDAEEVLYRLGLIALPDDEKASRAWLQRLADSHPGSPRIDDLKLALQGRSLDKSRLARIRLTAEQGDSAQAAQGYRELFNGKQPPPELALEYYQTLAGQDEHWQEARQGLERLRARQPDDPRVQLALASVLSYREATRRQAIDMLAELAPRLPEARPAWRRALLWLDAGARDEALYVRYSEANPTDAEVPARFQTALSAGRGNPGDNARNEGFNALRSLHNAAALQSFRQALNHNPRDAEAWGGLGVAQLRAQNYRDARNSLLKAGELAPATRDKWAKALADAAFYEKLQAARLQRDDGHLESAETLARQLAEGSGERPRAAKLLLADILIRQQKAAAAEPLYRSLLAEDPNNRPALAGLYGSLLQQDKRQAASDLLRSHPGLSDALHGGLQQVEALALRDRAEALRRQGDNEGAARLFGEALRLAPQNPWIRLSYARLLDASNDPQQARQMMEPLTTGPADAEVLHAATLLALDQGRWDDAAGYLKRIPPERRSGPELQALGQRVQTGARIAEARRAVAGGNRVVARQALRKLYDETPATPTARGETALALAELGDPAAALTLVREDLRDLSGPNASDYLGHVAVLVKTGQMSEADLLMHRLEQRGGLNADDLEGLQRLRNGFAVAQADRQRQSGDLAGAYDTLIASVDESPRDKDLLLAMGRLYDSGKMYKEAEAIYAKVLQDSPNNPEGVRGAVNAALGSHDPKRAAQLLDRAGPSLDEPTALLLSARVAEAKGDNRRAIALLESARRKRLAAAGARAESVPNGVPAFVARGNPFRAPGDAVPPLVLTDARHSGATEPAEPRTASPLTGIPLSRTFASRPSYTPADPLASEIETRLNALREKTATLLAASTGLRVRDGEDGLSQLTEVKAPLQLSMVPLNNARVEVTLTPTHLDAGTPGTDSTRRFGTTSLSVAQALDSGYKEALAALSDPTLDNDQKRIAAATRLNATQQAAVAALKSESQRDSGAALNLGIKTDSFQADIGTTPQGFEKTNIVGGAKWTPRVGQNGTVTLGVERRAVTDSLLSYAGTRDPITGKAWGGVTKTGVNVQYAYDNGDAGFYAGGDYHVYRGDNVANNSAAGLHTGAYMRPISSRTQELQTGVHLNWMGFDKNLSGYTLGHGGYFSPESFVGIAFPVQYAYNANRWNMKLRAAAGFQSFTQERAPYFPEDKALQNQLEQLQKDVTNMSGELTAAGLSASTPTIESYYKSDSQSGLAINGGATLEYSLGEQTKVGGTIGYDSFGNYTETTGSIYFKHALENLP